MLLHVQQKHLMKMVYVEVVIINVMNVQVVQINNVQNVIINIFY